MKHFQSSFSLKSFLAPSPIISSTWSSLWAPEDKTPPLIAFVSFSEVVEGNEQLRAHFPASHMGNLGSPRAEIYWNAVQMSKYFTHNWEDQTLTDFRGLNQNTLWTTYSLCIWWRFSHLNKRMSCSERLFLSFVVSLTIVIDCAIIFQPFRIRMISYWQAFIT